VQVLNSGYDTCVNGNPAGPAPESWSLGTDIPTGAQYQGAAVTIDVENACAVAMAEHAVTVEEGIMPIFLPVVLKNF
jgi:hypothetical protein